MWHSTRTERKIFCWYLSRPQCSSTIVIELSLTERRSNSSWLCKALWHQSGTCQCGCAWVCADERTEVIREHSRGYHLQENYTALRL